jgi:tRNA threonylcarbamoyladenosine biosynthesis protein TsaE
MALESSSGVVLTYTSTSPEDLTNLFPELLASADGIPVWLIEGDMGAGKTTFVSMFGKYASFLESVSSPTYSLVNEYRDTKGNIYYHFDFYRIKNEREAFEIGTEEYFYSGNTCFVEWPSLIPNLIPEKYIHISISIDEEHHRKITVTRHEN